MREKLNPSFELDELSSMKFYISLQNVCSRIFAAWKEKYAPESVEYLPLGLERLDPFQGCCASIPNVCILAPILGRELNTDIPRFAYGTVAAWRWRSVPRAAARALSTEPGCTGFHNARLLDLGTVVRCTQTPQFRVRIIPKFKYLL